MKLSVEIANHLKTLTVFTKNSIPDVNLGSKSPSNLAINNNIKANNMKM